MVRKFRIKWHVIDPLNNSATTTVTAKDERDAEEKFLISAIVRMLERKHRHVEVTKVEEICKKGGK